MTVPNHEAKASFGARHEAAMSSSGLRTRHLAQRVSGLCFLVLVLEGYDVSAMGYATPSLIEAWHASAPQFTTTVTVGAFGMLLGSLFAGILGDRIGRKPILIGCVAIFGVFTLLTARSTNLGSLTELRFLASLGLGGGVPLTIALATDYAIVQRPRRLVILMSSGLAIGSTGGFIARQFVTSFGWEAIFIFGGLLPILLASLPHTLRGWLPSIGIGGWFASESVAGMLRNHRLLCSGIRIQGPPAEYSRRSSRTPLCHSTRCRTFVQASDASQLL
jgi:MFS family permease